jgi:hypothetical protein
VRVVLVVLLVGCGRVGFEAHGGDAAAPATGYVIGPGGDDANPGTRDAPWRTFATLSRLRPGDTLTVLDGDYADAIDVDCDAGTGVSGTAAAPIVVRADHPRRARLFGGPQRLATDHCAYWEFDDLVLDGDDDAAMPVGDVVGVYHGDHIVLRGLLARHANRYGNTHCVQVGSSANTLVEDVEVYECFRGGFADYHSTASHYRRIYSNSRGIADLLDGYASECPGGDYGLFSYMSRAATVEDAIFEDACQAGLSIQTDPDEADGDTGVADGHLVDRVIAIGPGGHGLEVLTDCDGLSPCTSPDKVASGNRFTNSVAIGYSVNVWLEGEDNAADHISVFRGTVGVGLQAAGTGGLVASATLDSALVVGSLNGVLEANQTSWMVSHANVFDAMSPYNPNDTHVVASTTIDPQLGACEVVLPAGSPMVGAGTNGSNIGADIRTLASTGAPAWTPGWAGCGATFPGINDDPTTSCTGVQGRLGFASGCPQP